MPECSLCHRDGEPGREVRVYTGKILRQERRERGPDEDREGVVETSYGDFQEHRYFVCNRCRRRWDWVTVPATVGLSIIATLILASAALRHATDVLFGAALAVLVGGIIGAGAFSVNERLKRAARRARGRESTRAFSEQEYKAMEHMG